MEAVLLLGLLKEELERDPKDWSQLADHLD